MSLVLPTYLADIIHDVFLMLARHSRILCRHFVSKVASFSSILDKCQHAGHIMNCVKTYATKPRWESLWSVSQKIEKTCPIFCCCSRSKALGIGAEHFLSAPTERQNVAGSLRSSPKEFSPEEEKPGWEPSPLSWSDWEGGMAESGDSCRVGFVCRAERMSLRHCRLLRGRSRSKAHI